MTKRKVRFMKPGRKVENGLLVYYSRLKLEAMKESKIMICLYAVHAFVSVE